MRLRSNQRAEEAKTGEFSELCLKILVARSMKRMIQYYRKMEWKFCVRLHEPERREQFLSLQTLWLVLLIVFAGVEGITAGLVSVWFCAGSLVALIATWLGASLPVQIALFVIVSLAAMALVRPLARKWVQPKLVKTNADRILGQEAVVLEEIDNLRAVGQIKVGGAVWTARSTQEEPIPKGTLVRVERIEGVKAIVSPAGPTASEEANTSP